MDYIRTHCKSKDYKLLAIGHSMGGILLYAMMSRYGNVCLCHVTFVLVIFSVSGNCFSFFVVCDTLHLHFV